MPENLAPRYCRDTKLSPEQLLRSLQEAVRENEENLPKMTAADRGITEDFVHHGTIRNAEHRAMLSRMAIPKKTFWKNKQQLTVSFLHGDQRVQERVEEHAKIWMGYMGIELAFIKSPRSPTDIRIAFDHRDGSWSYLGTDNRTIDKTEPTMNFGWLYPQTEDEEYHRTVLHEFGHALGCIHEHQHPAGGIPWDKPKAYAYYEKQGWTREEVNQQVFRRYQGDLCRDSKVDKKSIMMYPIPEDITTGHYSVGWNDTLSVKDKSYIGKVYPK